jgi:hypothetical protein
VKDAHSPQIFDQRGTLRGNFMVPKCLEWLATAQAMFSASFAVSVASVRTDAMRGVVLPEGSFGVNP